MMSAYLASTKMCITAIQALVKALRNPASDNRIHAACALGKISEEAKHIVEALTAALGDVDEAVCQTAAYALGKMGELAVPALIEALGAENEEVRFHAIVALGEMGQSAQEAVPALINGLDDENEGVIWLAVQTLQEIGTPQAIRAVERYEKSAPVPVCQTKLCGQTL